MLLMAAAADRLYLVQLCNLDGGRPCSTGGGRDLRTRDRHVAPVRHAAALYADQRCSCILHGRSVFRRLRRAEPLCYCQRLQAAGLHESVVVPFGCLLPGYAAPAPLAPLMLAPGAVAAP